MLFGKVGQGKSSLGNFILRERRFETNLGLASVTGEACIGTTTFESVNLRIIDTPGLGDSEDIQSDEKALNEIGNGLYLAVEDGTPGVDAMFFVLSVAERFGSDHEKIIRYFEQMGEFWPYVCVIFTNADRLGSSTNEQQDGLDKMISSPRCPSKLKWLIENVEDRVIIVNTQSKDDIYYAETMEKVMKIITTIGESTSGRRYTNALFIQALDQLNEAKKRYESAEARIKFQETMISYLKEEIRRYSSAFKEQAPGIYRVTKYALKTGNNLATGLTKQEDFKSELECFPGDAVVLTSRSVAKPVSQLLPGDEVLCFSATDGKIKQGRFLAFIHYNSKTKAFFKKIHTEYGVICITPNHLIFTVSDGYKPIAIFANDIKIGDKLLFTIDGHTTKISHVTNITDEVKIGIYAPLTSEGTAIVNNIFVSCYASYDNHSLAHLSMQPLILYYEHFKYVAKEGINVYAAFLFHVVSIFKTN